MSRLALSLVALSLFCTSAYAQASKVTKETIPGITNFARLETTVACGGATKAEAVPAIKQMGFASIINVREASEPGADVEQEAAAARAVGLNFVNVPFNVASPAPDLSTSSSLPSRRRKTPLRTFTVRPVAGRRACG